MSDDSDIVQDALDVLTRFGGTVTSANDALSRIEVRLAQAEAERDALADEKDAVINNVLEGLEAAEARVADAARTATWNGLTGEQLLARLAQAEAKRDDFKTLYELSEGGWDDAEREVDALRARVASLEAALRRVKDELGVPGPDYAAPVANAVGVVDAALSKSEATPPRNPASSFATQQDEDAYRAVLSASGGPEAPQPDPITQGMERLAAAQESVRLTQPSVFGKQWAEAEPTPGEPPA